MFNNIQFNNKGVRKMGRWKRIFVRIMYVITLVIVPLSMMLLSIESAWAEQKGSKVSIEGEATDQDHKSEIEILQQPEQKTEPTSQKGSKGLQGIQGEAKDKDHRDWIDIQR
jgi:type VI protein secretion system component Hcp